MVLKVLQDQVQSIMVVARKAKDLQGDLQKALYLAAYHQGKDEQPRHSYRKSL